MNGLDLVVVAILVLSGLFAFARGFVKEALSIAAWGGAAFAAYYAFPAARHFVRGFFPEGPVADAAAGIGVFVVALIVLSLVASAISRRVKHSSLSALDRTFGLLFGLARGALIVCLAYVALAWLLPPGEQPQWMAQARTLPLLASGAQALRQLMPTPVRDRAAVAAARTGNTVQKEVESAIRAYSLPHPATTTAPAASRPAAAPAYSQTDQRELNRLFEQNAH
jgi:membrane protein required for colicin V production